MPYTECTNECEKCKSLCRGEVHFECDECSGLERVIEDLKKEIQTYQDHKHREWDNLRKYLLDELHVKPSDLMLGLDSYIIKNNLLIGPVL